jgi:hypothetical protein
MLDGLGGGLVKARAPMTEGLEVETLRQSVQKVGPEVDRPHVTVLAVPDEEAFLRRRARRKPSDEPR